MNAQIGTGWNGRRVVLAQDTFPRLASEPVLANLDPEALTAPYRQTVHGSPPQYARFPRLLYKNGAYTLIGKNIPNITSRFILDFWNTLLDMRWIFILFFFLVSNLLLWLVFGGIFWIISYLHGDYDAPSNDTEVVNKCIEYEDNSTSFAAAFLFSVETLRTIGYGTPRYPTEECVGTLFFLCFGLLVSCLLESVLVGLLLAKTHVPQKRTATLIFSDKAVICTREGQMCLLFRIGNVRTSLLFRVALKAFLVYAKKTDEGEEMPFHQHEIHLQIDANGDGVYLGWPTTACHVIDSSSPFYHVSRKNLSRAAFEIIVILEGIVESTGASIQARTSYIPDEILWGRHFKACYEEVAVRNKALFDFTHFNSTIPQFNMRDLSAFEREALEELKQIGTPTILLSGVDLVDSASEIHFGEKALSPSLAKALDIPYDQPRSRAGSLSTTRVNQQRRASVTTRVGLAPPKEQPSARRLSRVDYHEMGSMRLPHVCHLPRAESDIGTGNCPTRRVLSNSVNSPVTHNPRGPSNDGQPYSPLRRRVSQA